MGVMQCSRTDCDNIYCDTYFSGIGYICNECKESFKKYLEKQGIEKASEGEFKRHLDLFMKTSADFDEFGSAITVDQFFSGGD
jgi:hypothetical protein